MPIEKLEEFARDGQKNTDELILTDGFPRPKFPARQWFNYLFNMLSLKINEIIDLDPVARSEIIDNLTTNDATKPVSAKQAKLLQDSKLDKTANAVSATKLQTARTIGGVSFDGTANITLPTATTARSGTVQLNDTLTSTSNTQALTAAQGKVLNDQAFGIGQTWQNVKENRVAGVTYTNTTGKPIQLYLYQGVNGSTLTISGNTMAVHGNSMLCVAIPPNATYSISSQNIEWWEFR